MLKHGFLIMAHKYPEQFKDIINMLNAPNHYFFVNIDKKNNMEDFYTDLPNCHFLTDSGGRMDVAYAGYSMVECTLRLLKAAYDAGMDYFHLISAQDYPCRQNKEFDEFFEKHKPQSYMYYDSEEERSRWMDNKYASRIKPWYLIDIRHRNIKIINLVCRGFNFISRRFWWRKDIPNLYAGWLWFSWYKDVVGFVLNELQVNKEFFKRFHHTCCCDELVFHTLLAPHIDELNIESHNSLRYINWHKVALGRNNPGSPLTLNEEEYDEIMSNGALFCRKVHPVISKKLIEKLKQQVSGA